jgi:hypothetical protein
LSALSVLERRGREASTTTTTTTRLFVHDVTKYENPKNGKKKKKAWGRDVFDLLTHIFCFFPLLVLSPLRLSFQQGGARATFGRNCDAFLRSASAAGLPRPRSARIGAAAGDGVGIDGIADSSDSLLRRLRLFPLTLAPRGHHRPREAQGLLGNCHPPGILRAGAAEG